MGPNGNGAGPRFHDVITTEAALRAVIGEAGDLVWNKVIAQVDDHCRQFIAKSPFLLIASSDSSGILDVSPKGDPAGFVKVLDDHTLVIPDRLGNRRVDTFRNVLQNPNVGLIFLVPSRRDTLRISGKARIVRDASLLATMAIKGRAPDLALVLHVERALFHCAKSVIRSSLWDPAGWPDATGVSSPAESLLAHARPEGSVADMQKLIDDDIRERLY
jgi:PPOX class probable FMN-dependent enzyme